MSLNYGYWPEGFIPARGTCGAMLRPHNRAACGDANVITLPDRYVGGGSQSYCADKAFGYDEFARAAAETMRDSYQPMPTAGVKEFAAFFSRPNYEQLLQEVQRRSGYPMEREQLMNVMIEAYSMIRPRSDGMDVERRLVFTPEVTQSYVDEMNRYVLDNTVEENKQANRQWEFLAKNRNGPSEFPDHLEVDTRTRFNGSLYAADYWIPDD